MLQDSAKKIYMKKLDTLECKVESIQQVWADLKEFSYMQSLGATLSPEADES